MATDIPTCSFSEPVDVAEYLFTRLFQIGIRSIHGVPGDFNLLALDYVTLAGLMWVGNCNELNAGYAADGYARVKGISAVVTKCGVGELSVVNAIAGAFSEYVPVIHIVGTPSAAAQTKDMLLQHTLSNGDTKVFESIAKQITCAITILDDSCDIAILIDEAIKDCWTQSRPVYISLPIDLVQKKVEGKRLKTRIDFSLRSTFANEEEVVKLILEQIYKASKPVILIDAGAYRRRILGEVEALVCKSGIPTFVTPMGKGAIDETSPNYAGVYAGDASETWVREFFESLDLVLHIGSIKSDSTTSWCRRTPFHATTIDFHIGDKGVQIADSYYTGTQMKSVLRTIVDTIDVSACSFQAGPNLRSDDIIQSSDSTITHQWLWPRVGQWLQEGDLVITETGTSNYGIRETIFPRRVQAICQPLWSSIGYATAACQGAALAAKELGIERTILFTGEGSFQLSGQELSTMIRHNLNPIIFVICNGGYTTERFIHGMDAVYNDIQPWRYGDLCNTYGGEGHTKTYKVETKQQLEHLLSDQEFVRAQFLRFVEVYMQPEDAPKGLISSVNATPERG